MSEPTPKDAPSTTTPTPPEQRFGEKAPDGVYRPKKQTPDPSAPVWGDGTKWGE